ncbi:MAG: hypothetical protein ACXVXZ_13900 [Mycobacteriaceae bacterium]
MIAPTTATREAMVKAGQDLEAAVGVLQQQLKELAARLNSTSEEYRFYNGSENYRYAADLTDSAWRALEHAKVALHN